MTKILFVHFLRITNSSFKNRSFSFGSNTLLGMWNFSIMPESHAFFSRKIEKWKKDLYKQIRISRTRTIKNVNVLWVIPLFKWCGRKSCFIWLNLTLKYWIVSYNTNAWIFSFHFFYCFAVYGANLKKRIIIIKLEIKVQCRVYSCENSVFVVTVEYILSNNCFQSQSSLFRPWPCLFDFSIDRLLNLSFLYGVT